MCDYCRMTEFGDGASQALVIRGNYLFNASVEVDQRIFPGAVMELYIGIGGTDILCERTKINYCPMCGRKLESEDTPCSET